MAKKQDKEPTIRELLDKEFLNCAEVARLINVHRNTVMAWALKGDFKEGASRWPNQIIRIRTSYLKKWWLSAPLVVEELKRQKENT